MGCVKTEEKDRVVIAVSTIGFTHGWPAGVLHHAEDEVRLVAEENGWDYIVVVADTADEQSDQVMDLIAKKVDCIVILPMEGTALKTATMAVQEANIPLVIFDREVPDFAPRATIKGDNSGIGVTTAECFNERFPNGTGVLEMMGDASTVPFQRTDGYDDTINENMKTIQLGYTGWQRDVAYDMFKRWVEESSQEEIDEIEAIFTHDDEIALGVLDALDEYRKDTSFAKNFDNLKVIAASSGSQEIFRRMKTEEDYEVFSLTYPPAMIREAIRTAEKIIKGEPYEEIIIFPTEYVDKENVDDFLDVNAPF